MTRRPDVSIVIPCYRAASVAIRTVPPLLRDLDQAGLYAEVVLVDDGGGDFGDSAFADPRVNLLVLPRNMGKGAAVRAGMQRAVGLARIFTDADVPFGSGPVVQIARRLLDGPADLVIGDRTLPGSEYRMRIGWGRRLASLVFTAFVGSIITSGFYDTQCGLKGLRGDVAERLLPWLRIDRFAFDVELLYIALKHGLAIERIPVQLVRNETSSVRLPGDAVRGAIDVLRIRYYFARGRYPDPARQVGSV